MGANHSWGGQIVGLEPGTRFMSVAIGGDERSVSGERVCRDGGVEVFDPLPLAFERRLDVPEALADGVRPRRSHELGTNEIEPFLKSVAALRTVETLLEALGVQPLLGRWLGAGDIGALPR